MTRNVHILAFDFGASSGRAILGRYDGSTLTAEAVHQFPNGACDAFGHLYWDVLPYFNELKEGIRRGAQQVQGPLSSIGIDTWGVDYGLLDSTGELLGMPYHYRDTRTQGMFEAATARMSRDEIFRRTGVAFQPFNTLFQLLAMKLAKPDVLDQARTLLLMPDLLSYYLTGETAAEYTHASTTQILDVHSRTWCDPLIDAMKLPRGIFPEIQPPGTVRGILREEVCHEACVAALPVVAVASHDTASAVLAVPLRDEQSAYLSSGTWSLLGVESKSPVLGDHVRNWKFTNEGGFGDTYRVLRNVMGLWIIQECKREWNSHGDPVGFEELVELARKSRGLRSFIDPDDPAFYAPGEMTGRIEEFCRATGQPIPASQGEIVRLVLESLALRYRWAVERLEKILGYAISSLHIVGGGAKNALLNQFTANALQKPVWSGPGEATAIGNLLVQLHAIGEVHGVQQMRDLVRKSFPSQLFSPEGGGEWDEAYGRFLKIVKKDE
jgi:rhamnulokinase